MGQKYQIGLDTYPFRSRANSLGSKYTKKTYGGNVSVFYSPGNVSGGCK